MAILNHTDARVYVDVLPTGKNRVRVELTTDDLFSPVQLCETSYPLGLIDNILTLKGPAYLCDEILRDESPEYVQKSLQYDLLSYLDIGEFDNKRLLDFGCGSGASTITLARMLPRTEIVGIELEEQFLSIAKLRTRFYGYDNIHLMISPNSCSLPPGIGCFDFVVLSAVYEHLLPDEREVVLQQGWSILKPGGILFVNQTPYRYFPVESHTTSDLLLINYLPDKIALLYARYCSKRKLKDMSWNALLRAGIRGGSVKEILSGLGNAPQGPVLLEPDKSGIKDRIDLWYVQSGGRRLGLAKRVFRVLARLLQRLTGVIVVPNLSLAIRKG